MIISLPVVLCNVIVLSEVLCVAVTPDTSWLISAVKFSNEVWTEIVFPFIVNVFDIDKDVLAADVNVLNAEASAPWLLEFAFIAEANALAVLFPELRSEDKVEAKAFSPLIFISLTPRFELL